MAQREEAPMIKRMRICNFKSLRDTVIELGKFNVLIGPNASGKTNIIQALKLLRDIMDPGVLNPFADYWGYANAVWMRDESLNVRFELDFTDGSRYELEVTGAGGRFEVVREFVKIDSLRVRREGLSISVRVKDEEITGQELIELNSREPMLITSSPVELVRPVLQKIISVPEALKIAEPWFTIMTTLERIQPLSLNARRAKEASPPIRTEVLAPDGSNLHAVLYTLRYERGSLPKRFYELVSRAFPGVEELRLEFTGDGRVHLIVRESGAYMLPMNMSDGFYKFLAILTALELGPSLLAIDEIENSIHHETMELLIDELRHADCQVLLTTHSPVVLDLCDPGEVLLAYKGPEGTKVRRVPEPEELRKRLRELGLTLGESWVYGGLSERP